MVRWIGRKSTHDTSTGIAKRDKCFFSATMRCSEKCKPTSSIFNIHLIPLRRYTHVDSRRAIFWVVVRIYQGLVVINNELIPAG